MTKKLKRYPKMVKRASRKTKTDTRRFKDIEDEDPKGNKWKKTDKYKDPWF